MRTSHAVETGRDRKDLAQDAGLGRFSLVSGVAGMLVGYGAFAVIAAIAAVLLRAVGVDTGGLTTNDWRQLGIGSGIAVALTLFLAYLFGGYVAGRMARRAGAANGLLVFVLGILVAAGIGAAVGTQTDGAAVTSNLRSIGVPTTGAEWSAIGTIAGLGALLAMLVGALAGGIAGERWHGKLMARALDPAVGTPTVSRHGAAAGGPHPHERTADLRSPTATAADGDGDTGHHLDVDGDPDRDREITRTLR